MFCVRCEVLILENDKEKFVKKFLIVALLSSDLWAMNPSKVFELAYCENPTEQQVQMLHNAWDECLEEQRKWCKIANEEYKKNPYSEEYKKACEKSEKLNIELQTYLHNELSVVSRDIFSETGSAIDNIRRHFSTDETHVYNVRIIDACSYINGLYLSRSDKNSFLKALTSDEELLRQVDVFCRNHRFVDMSSQLLNNLESGISEMPNDLRNNPILKSSIRSHLLEDSKKSRVYREAMVAYLARERAFDFISDHYVAPNRFKDGLIVKYSEGMIHLSTKVLCYQYTLGYVNSLFESINSIPGLSAPWQFILDPKLIFFHEVGHINDFSSVANSWIDMNRTTKILPTLVNIKADLGIFDQIRPLLSEGLSKDEYALQYVKSKLKTNETNLDKILDLLRANLSDPFFISEFSFENSSEVLQILGVFFSSFNSNKNTFINTLYINKMSDFALFCEQGLPIRCDHFGYIETIDTRDELNDDKIEKRKFIKIKLREMLKYDLPLESYGSLMEFYGISMQAYVLKLMYPYGLISQLQTEHRLNSNLKEFKQIYGWDLFLLGEY